MDKNPYASPVATVDASDPVPGWRLGVASLVGSLIALVLFVWIATQDRVEVDSFGHRFISWSSPEKMRLFVVAGFAWFLSLCAIVGGRHAIVHSLLTMWSRRMAISGIVVAGFNFVISIGYLYLRAQEV